MTGGITNRRPSQAIKRDLDTVFYEVERRTGVEFDMGDMDLMIESHYRGWPKARSRAG